MSFMITNILKSTFQWSHICQICELGYHLEYLWLQETEHQTKNGSK